jgi:hypothetical protein
MTGTIFIALLPLELTA